MKKLLTLLLMAVATLQASAQQPSFRKMSPLVRQAALSAELRSPRRAVGHRPADRRELCAFVRIDGDARQTLENHGCRQLAQFGDISIASIPLARLSALAAEKSVTRIEAGRPCTAQNDTSALLLNVPGVHNGVRLPQAYTGRGVVVGVEDIGFDLTHPTFYSSDLSEYRIKRFWDQLSADTVGSRLYVGADYQTEEDILAYQHSRDGLLLGHGTHTAGSAAGSGYDSPYRGMAFESDICLVSNAVGDDARYIADEDKYKYTSATDALGFKYLFDYATEHGQPCVVSFSEGAHPDLWGDDILFSEVISQLVGPGKILVASAGNESVRDTYLEKPADEASRGVFIRKYKNSAYLLFRGDDHFGIRMKVYNEEGEPDELTFTTEHMMTLPDSVYIDTLQMGKNQYVIAATAYPSCYDSTQVASELYIVTTARWLGYDELVSLEMVADDIKTEMFFVDCYVDDHSDVDPTLCPSAEHTHNILMPGAAPDVICVGSSSYRTGIVNFRGTYLDNNLGEHGEHTPTSSVGPTLYGGMKPDVVAPGVNVISSWSSFFMEGNGGSPAHGWAVKHFNYNGREYAWTADSGTSMSTPLVAGIIALWLQANPNLSPDDVRGVLARTCSHTDTGMDYPNNTYGHGEIDAYAGLLDVLSLSGIEELSALQPRRATFSLCGRQLQIGFGRQPLHPLTLSIYATDGRLVHTEHVDRPQTTHDLSLQTLPPGVYAVQIATTEQDLHGSTLIRID